MQTKIAQEEAVTKILLFGNSTELNRLLGKKGTMEILLFISEQGRQYKDLEVNIKLSESTLFRRTQSLLRLKILQLTPTLIKGRKTQLYILGPLGIDLMKFIKRYERLTSIPKEQTKING